MEPLFWVIQIPIDFHEVCQWWYVPWSHPSLLIKCCMLNGWNGSILDLGLNPWSPVWRSRIPRIFQNSKHFNPIPSKAICGDFYRTVLAKHLSGISSILVLYLLSSLSLSFWSISRLYQHQFPTVCRTASRLLWRHWSAGALAKVLHKEFNRRSQVRVVRVAEFWSKAGASCQIQYDSGKILAYYVDICVFSLQRAPVLFYPHPAGRRKNCSWSHRGIGQKLERSQSFEAKRLLCGTRLRLLRSPVVHRVHRVHRYSSVFFGGSPLCLRFCPSLGGKTLPEWISRIFLSCFKS